MEGPLMLVLNVWIKLFFVFTSFFVLSVFLIMTGIQGFILPLITTA